MSICAENITWKVGKKAIVNDVSLKVSGGNRRPAGPKRLRKIVSFAYPRGTASLGCGPRDAGRAGHPASPKSSLPAG